MRHLFHLCWHKAREWLGDLFFIGLFILIFGTAPEKWVENRLEWLGGLIPALDLITLAKRSWPDWLDVRVALVAFGVTLSSGSVIWRQLAHRRPRSPPSDPTPAKHIVLPSRSLGPLFKGRDQLLRDLRASLTIGHQAAITSQALYGTGGIGKTRAAVEYAWTHQSDYTALLCVTADSPEALRSNLAALVNPLALSEREVADQEVRRTAVQRWLCDNPGWLLILDNVDTPAALAEANAQMAGVSGGHLLITSRLADFPVDLPALEIGLLSPADAVAFLQARTAQRRKHAADDEVVARALAEHDLGRLALALEQAGAYISHRRCSLAEYQAMLRTNGPQLMTWFNPAVMHYPRSVAETWQTSVDQLSEAGRHLLERLAFLAPDPVPGSLLKVPVPDTEAEDATAALDDLAAYSLVTRDVESGTFLLHRLVQDVTRRRLEATGTTTARLTEALGWVNAAFDGEPGDVRTWGRLDPLAPHAEAVVGRADAAGIAEPTLRLMGQLGVLFYAKALHTRAEGHSRRALALAEASYGNDHPNVAIRLNNLAQLLQATNRLGEAEPLMRRALGIDEASHGKDHPTVATHLNNLAQLLQATNRLGEAEPLMRRALGIDEASYGNDHPDVATDLNNLAALLQATNRLGEAEPLMRRALGIDETSYGKDHPRVAIRLNNLAQLLQATNRLGEAEPLMRRALGIDEASYGNDHPLVAIRLNNLAQLLQATNRLDEAEPLMRRALGIDEASYGKDHPEVATDLNNLARLLQATNRLDEAEPLMRRALGIDEASYGKDHPEVATDLNNLARLLQATNRLGEAEPLMRRTVVIILAFERDTGHAHPHRDAAIQNYTGLLAAIGKTEAEIATATATLRHEAGLPPE